MEGKLVNLPKPLAVMRREQIKSSEEVAEGLMEDEPQTVDRATHPPRWDIVAVVKRKMVFAKRPMPIVGKPPSTAEPPSKG